MDRLQDILYQIVLARDNDTFAHHRIASNISRSMEVRKFNQLDSLRFFAVFLVVCIHWGGWFGCQFFDMLASGSRGVNSVCDQRFLVSLWDCCRSRDNDQSAGTSLYKFYARRFLRIFPIYYLLLILLWFVDHGRVANGIWWYVFYASNFYCIKIQDWGGLGHLWSLAVEEQFYLVWPFIILLYIYQAAAIRDDQCCIGQLVY
jgi:peptidoglycan/LPS O-acetylase OafA/YrhL